MIISANFNCKFSRFSNHDVYFQGQRTQAAINTFPKFQDDSFHLHLVIEKELHFSCIAADALNEVISVNVTYFRDL